VIVGRLWSQLAPRRSASEIAGVAVDAVRSRRELIVENASSATRSTYFDAAASARSSTRDRRKLLIGARLLPSWRRVIAMDPSKPIAVKSVLGGLHVDYRRAA
jgi:hypothetical protein